MVLRSTDAKRITTMRNNTMIRHWSIVATAAAAALGFSTMALAQTNASGDRDSSQGGMMTSMTTPQVAALVKHAKHSLADSINGVARLLKITVFEIQGATVRTIFEASADFSVPPLRSVGGDSRRGRLDEA
jgi:hypothetical protein